MSYKITNDEMKWKKEPEIKTTTANVSTTASNPTMFEKCFGLKFNVEKMPNAALIYNMANSLKKCHLKYENMKRMSNAQKEEMEIIHLGVILVIQMHCNDTGTRNDKTVKETFALITERHHMEAVKEDATSIKMRLEGTKLQENNKKDANPTFESSEEEEESNDEEEMVYDKSKNRKRNFFDDDDEDYDPNKNNTDDDEEMVYEKTNNKKRNIFDDDDEVDDHEKKHRY